ncbi:hypothetical protein PR202_ga18477 [Eleusine coracana subsp. coracana]|uniref:NAC domain-containing protein n=1 Tax=Eleusine coracana subsp. coracana TaxID=191504 RepID=A0AAV5CT91_ELECO|nr:hypothetical protein PR202_ga18477 [Eleusine coracana subsp. coracana]
MMEECCACVPPGFRFHPTEEELVGYYLARKVASQKIELDIIQEVDLYRIEPWDLQAMCKYGGEQGEWYFFSYKDRKYPSGTRTNRATAAGFWKATGRDKPVTMSRSGRVIGMRKTLVFYKGRAPNGRKTHWIMHEYRLQSNDHLPAAAHHNQEEGWVVCRAFQKPIPNHQLYHPISYPGGGYGDHHFLGSTTTALVSHPEIREISSSSFPQLMYNNAEVDQLFESKNKLLLTIPQLMETPTAIDDDDDDELLLQQQGKGGGGGELQAAASGAIDWNFLDTLLLSSSTASQLHDPAASSSLHLQ